MGPTSITHSNWCLIGAVIPYYTHLLHQNLCPAPKKQYNNVIGLTSDTASIQRKFGSLAMMLTSRPSVSLRMYLRLSLPYSASSDLGYALRGHAIRACLSTSKLLMYHVCTSTSFQRKRLVSSLVDGNPRSVVYMIVDIIQQLKTPRRFPFPIDTCTGDSSQRRKTLSFMVF